jgi:hypothetical protein
VNEKPIDTGAVFDDIDIDLAELDNDTDVFKTEEKEEAKPDLISAPDQPNQSL